MFERLFKHVVSNGGRFSWGRGQTPGVSGWYSVNGSPMAVWTAHAGAATPGSRPYMYLYLPQLKQRLTPERFEAVIATLGAIVPAKAKLDEAASNLFESKYPSMYLGDLAKDPAWIEGVFAAIHLAIDS